MCTPWWWLRVSADIFWNDFSVDIYECSDCNKSYLVGPSGGAVKGDGMRLLACWDSGFESHREHSYLPLVMSGKGLCDGSIPHPEESCRLSVCGSAAVTLCTCIEYIQCGSFVTRPKKMRISRRLFIRFWTCIYDYIPCFMKSMSIRVRRSLTSWRHRDNDWRLAPCRVQPCHCVVR